MILSTIENQYGEEVSNIEVYFRNGSWFYEYLNCRSSQDHGLGNCRCISHQSYITTQISREEVKKYLGENICKLNEEERNDLLTLSLEKKIEEKFSLLGFTLEQVEKWAEDCYKMNINPLPTLRNHLEGICKVGFAYRSNGAFWAAEKPTLVCWLTQGNEPQDTTVELEVIDVA